MPDMFSEVDLETMQWVRQVFNPKGLGESREDVSDAEDLRGKRRGLRLKLLRSWRVRRCFNALCLQFVVILFPVASELLAKIRTRQCRVPTILFSVGTRHCRVLYIIPMPPVCSEDFIPLHRHLIHKEASSLYQFFMRLHSIRSPQPP